MRGLIGSLRLPTSGIANITRYAERLRYRTDEVDFTGWNEGQDRAGTEDVEKRNHRRREQNRPRESARRSAGFAGKNRYKFKAAKRPQRSFW